ncbi:MAG: hypothetical protein U5L98_15045 [Halomonas sp.]|uniref:hypothetical protein n=1 Tax=Halomonas sp. TaxID=1486246 RepID=UPI002ACD9986|nr:hypothetical protein [Halomonas sp.]MDZ7853917.1 hypothetical protein [Halomonas sp.]
MNPRVDMIHLPQALLAELIRRYWVLDIECSMLEVHHLAWLLVRQCQRHRLPDPLGIAFQARRYGPYADSLRAMIIEATDNLLDYEGDVYSSDVVIIWLDVGRHDDLATRLATPDAEPYLAVIEEVDALIDGFQSPLGVEVLATLDWLISQDHVEPTVEAIKEGLRHWPDDVAGQRKLRLFSDRLIELALVRLTGEAIPPSAQVTER